MSKYILYLSTVFDKSVDCATKIKSSALNYYGCIKIKEEKEKNERKLLKAISITPFTLHVTLTSYCDESNNLQLFYD